MHVLIGGVYKGNHGGAYLISYDESNICNDLSDFWRGYDNGVHEWGDEGLAIIRVDLPSKFTFDHIDPYKDLEQIGEWREDNIIWTNPAFSEPFGETWIIEDLDADDSYENGEGETETQQWYMVSCTCNFTERAEYLESMIQSIGGSLIERDDDFLYCLTTATPDQIRKELCESLCNDYLVIEDQTE